MIASLFSCSGWDYSQSPPAWLSQPSGKLFPQPGSCFSPWILVASSLSLPSLLSCWRCLPSSPLGWDGVLPSTLNCSLKDGMTLPHPLKRTEENFESFLDSKNLPQNEPGCDSCSTPEDGWDEVLLWHEHCDAVVSARGELLLFSPRSGSPRVPLKVVQGPYLWHWLCSYIFNRISGSSF